MPIVHHGIRSSFITLTYLILLSSHGVLLVSFNDLSQSTTNISNVFVTNISYGLVHSVNFLFGQSQPPNISCSWTIDNGQQLVPIRFILSFRILDIETDSTHWSNELSIWTGSRQIVIDDINKRALILSPSIQSRLQINFRSRPPSIQPHNPHIRTSLRIRKFALEFVHSGSPNDLITTNDDEHFRCKISGQLLPKQWRCNCIRECPYEDESDEENCTLCSLIDSTKNLLCRSDEYWCLPIMPRESERLSDDADDDDDDWMKAHVDYSRKIDAKGVCLPRQASMMKCTYSTVTSNCQTVIAWRQDRGVILLDSSTLGTSDSLCFVIIAQVQYKIKLFVDQIGLLDRRPDLELLIFDGSEQQKQPLVSSHWLLMKDTVQTRENHIATVIIRKRMTFDQQHEYLPVPILNEHHPDDVLGYFNTNETSLRFRRTLLNRLFLLNITWLTSLCPDNQILCSGHFETKCYTKEQRCDGLWDCISGDDELGCSPESCPTTFACNDRLRSPSDQPRCYTWSERCNGNAFCANRTDEKLCSNWWCHSQNGTFLCQNLRCIYETWVCDGADDCGDHSDEINCPSRIPRRIVTAAVIGATVCCTLFIIALGCTCKLFHLRTAERRATSRLLNPQRYIQHRRQQLQQQQQRRINRRNCQRPSTTTSSSSTTTLAATTTATTDPSISNEIRRLAPPSYNQTMGLMDENEERHAALAEHLRLAGLSNFISVPPVNSNTRTSRSASRHRHRRHRRHRHHHHHRRAHSEGSRVALLEPNVVLPTTAFPLPSTSFPSNRFHRFRSQIRSLFTNVRSHNSTQPLVSSPPNEFDIYERQVPPPPPAVLLSSRSYLNSDFIQPPIVVASVTTERELPPPYSEQQQQQQPLLVSTTTTTSSRRSSSSGSDLESSSSSSMPGTRLRKRQAPMSTLRDRMRQLITGTTTRITPDGCSLSTSHPMQPTNISLTFDDHVDQQQQPPIATDDEEHPSSDDDKMLTP